MADNSQRYESYGIVTGSDEWEGQFDSAVSLFSQTNSIASQMMQERLNTQPLDLSEYTAPFSDDSMAEHLKNQPAWIASQMLGDKPRDWKEYATRLRWYKAKEASNAEVQKHFSTAEQLISGFTVGLVDTDMLIGAPVIKGAKAIYKGAGLLTKAAKISKNSSLAAKWANASEAAFLGASGAVASNMVFEAIDGIEYEGSNTNAALFGAALGGGIGVLANTLGKRVAKTTDAAGNPIDKDLERKVLQEQIDTHTAELKQMEDALKIQKNLRESYKEAQGKSKNAVGTVKKKLEGQQKALKQKIKDANAEVKAIEKSIKEAQQAATKASDDLEKLAAKQRQHNTLRSEREGYAKEAEAIEAKASALLERIQAVKEELSGLTRNDLNTQHLRALRDKLEANYRDLNKEAKFWRKEEKALDRKLAQKKNSWTKADEDEMDYVRLLSSESRNYVTRNQGFSNAAYVEGLQRELGVAEDSLNIINGKPTIDDVKALSGEGPVTDVMTKADRLKSLATDIQEFKAFLKEKDLLNEKIFKMRDKNFSLPSLIRQQKSVIKSLNDDIMELDGIFSSENKKSAWSKIKESNAYKNAPQPLQKFVISPIERLFASATPEVRGLASLLHPGTLWHGFVTENNTVFHIKERLNRQAKAAADNHRTSYKEARAAGYKGSETEFGAAVTEEIYRVNGAAQKEARAGIDKTLPPEKIHEKVQQKLNASRRVYTTSNEQIIKAVDGWLDYYESMAKIGTSLEMTDFLNIALKGYTPRRGSIDKIVRMGGEAKAIDHLVQMQKKYALDNNIKISEPELKARAAAFVKATMDKSQNRRAISRPLGARSTSEATAIQARKMMAYDDDIAAVLEDQIVGITESYKMATHGRFALKEKLGVDTMEQMDKLIEQTGASVKETALFNQMVRTVLGTVGLDKNPYSLQNQAINMASSVSSLMHIMSFGIPTMTEIAAPIAKTGFMPVLKSLGVSSDMIYNIYRFGSTSDRNSLALIADVGNHWMNHKLSRVDVENVHNDVNKVQTHLNEATRLGGVYGGLVPITDAYKLLSIVADLNWMAGLRKADISKADLVKLEQMGFGIDDLDQIHRAIQLDSKGNVDLSKELSAGDRAFRQKLDDALYNFRQSTVLEPSGATLPGWLADVNTNGLWTSRVFFKFMNFPVESYERLLLNGIQHGDAKVVSGTLLNAAMWSMILTAKDAVKGEDKKQYEGDEGNTKLMLDSLLYSSIISGPVALLDKAAALRGTSLMGYPSSWGGVLERDIESLMKGKPKVGVWGVNVNLGEAAGNALNYLGIMQDEAKLAIPSE